MVALLSFGWKLSFRLLLVQDQNVCMWFSLSLRSPKGETEPGINPKYFVIRFSDANVSFPCFSFFKSTDF